MSFPKYPAYKASGVEWLGEIPEGWSVSSIKRCSYLKARVGWKGLTSDEFEEDSYAYLVTGSDFRGSKIQWHQCYQVNKARYDDDPFIHLIEGDLLITKDGTVGKLALVEGLDKPACLNSGIFLLRPLHSYLTNFMEWVLRSKLFSHFVDLRSYGSTINHLYQNVFEEFSFPLPTLSEQKAIASFLECECAKIDALIAEQERLITLLQEKRQAVISHAVTKGLEPNVPMKESGIEWIGKIPKQWEIFKLRRLTHLKSGDAITSEQFNDESPYPVFGGNGIRGYTHNFNCRGTFPIIGRQGALCGNITVSSGNFWASEHAIVVYPKISYEPLWMANLLENMRLNQYSLSAAQPGLAVERIMDLFIPVPPHNEQKEIVTFISKEIERDIKIKIASKNTISLLKERRSALISAAVTGKIDVRTLVKPKDIAA